MICIGVETRRPTRPIGPRRARPSPPHQGLPPSAIGAALPQPPSQRRRGRTARRPSQACPVVPTSPYAPGPQNMAPNPTTVSVAGTNKITAASRHCTAGPGARTPPLETAAAGRLPRPPRAREAPSPVPGRAVLVSGIAVLLDPSASLGRADLASRRSASLSSTRAIVLTGRTAPSGRR